MTINGEEYMPKLLPPPEHPYIRFLRDALTPLCLLRPDGSRIPPTLLFWRNEQIVLKNYTFRVAYVGDHTLLLEPVGPVPIIGEDK